MIADVCDKWICVTQRNTTTFQKKFNNAQLCHLGYFETQIFVAGWPLLAKQVRSMTANGRLVFRLHRFVDVTILTHWQNFSDLGALKFPDNTSGNVYPGAHSYLCTRCSGTLISFTCILTSALADLKNTTQIANISISVGRS